jgi:outer membrane immunogenic protein
MTSTKHALAAAAILCACLKPAQAADLGSGRKLAQSPSRAEHMAALWQGFHAGISLGATGTAVDLRGVGIDQESDDRSAKLGAFVRNNFVNGPWVWGVEADLSGHGIDKKKKAVPDLGDESSDQGSLGSVRLRVGDAWNNALLYGTAGLALSNLEVKSSLGGTSEIKAGLVFGLGADWAFDMNWTERVEAQAYGFGNNEGRLAGTNRETVTGTSTVRFGVARRFC